MVIKDLAILMKHGPVAYGRWASQAIVMDAIHAEAKVRLAVDDLHTRQQGKQLLKEVTQERGKNG